MPTLPTHQYVNDPYVWLARRVAAADITLTESDRIRTRTAIDHRSRTIWIRRGLPWPVHFLSTCRAVSEIMFPALSDVLFEEHAGGVVVPLRRTAN